MVAFRLDAHGSVTPTERTVAGAASAVDGKAAFRQNCASCHTLANAHATGTVGPNLDELKPSEPTVERQVTNGGGMPSFDDRLSRARIEAIATYVSTHAGN